MSDKLEALKASARGIARLLGDIASFDSWDIDCDTVEIRFEDENGCDTGTDVSITEMADKASQAIGELLAALEAKTKAHAAAIEQMHFHEQRADVAEQKLAAFPADWTKDSGLATWFPFTAAKLAELEQLLQQPIKLPKRKSAAEYVDEEFSNADLAAIHNVTILECSVKIKNAGFKVEVEGE